MYEVSIKISEDILEAVNDAYSFVNELNSIIKYSINNGINYKERLGYRVDEFKITAELGEENNIILHSKVDGEYYKDGWYIPIYPNETLYAYVYTTFNNNKIINNIRISLRSSENFIIKDFAHNDPTSLKGGAFNISIYSELNSYKEYLKTYDWNEARKNALNKSKYKCQLCGKKNIKLNVHHNTYENLGKEKEEDLIVLCDKCHEKFHDIVTTGDKHEN